jgi:predicted RNase H-like nuclease (RuvC/YqgF family)
MGINAYEAAQAIHKVSQALNNSNRNTSNISVLQTEINNLKYQTQNNAYFQDKISELEANVHDLRTKAYTSEASIDSRTAALEWEISDLRSALDAQTEKSKQKSDLEIFSAIEWDEEFLKIMNEPIIVDF